MRRRALVVATAVALTACSPGEDSHDDGPFGGNLPAPHHTPSELDDDPTSASPTPVPGKDDEETRERDSLDRYSEDEAGYLLPDVRAWAEPGTAEWTAARYTEAALSLDYRWPDIGHWVELAADYMAQDYLDETRAAVNAALEAGRDDAHWRDYQVVERREEVRVIHAYVVTAAPLTEDERVVEVRYQLTKRGTDVWRGRWLSDELVRTARMVRADDGSWGVAAFETPNAG
ncbi:hypothetical protein [Phytoactinopolyspora mesophila]|uniref:Lipoprotein n=1 Tax=Phytoactinopolyspora mesophila TaxID=2650750 RepID=A0A7K3MB85_9ACTN|nr:hypothetical protein [Phytoactinopolyspora mesophila]NDL60232.1 hypothetical protein [Phytoactinopolyspora mesophila]